MAGQQDNPKTPMGGVSAFACKACGGQVQLLAPGQTLSAACSHCGAIIDLSDDNFRVISTFKSKQPFEPVIPIGTRGTLEGHTWECIGAVLRQAEGYDYFWEEYLLFNPWQGFRFLVHNHGHWSLVGMLVDYPDNVSHSGMHFDGQSFKRFTAGNAIVAGVLGEFYWQVHYGDTAQTADYIAPPYMLSVEVEEGGMIWSKGTYLEREVVKEAFQLDVVMPRPHAPGMNQPNPYKKSALLTMIVGGIGLVLALVLQVMFTGSATNTVAYSTVINRTGATDTLVSPVFELTGASGNVEVRATAYDLQNSWVEASGYLHNIETLENYGVEAGLEYYSGVDGGESWSEGSKSGDQFHNMVPGGKYELVLSISGESTAPLKVEVVRNVPFFSNFLALLIFLVIVPGVYFILSRNFETRRWAEAE